MWTLEEIHQLTPRLRTISTHPIFFFYYREEVGAPHNCGLIITRTERWERKRRREKRER